MSAVPISIAIGAQQVRQGAPRSSGPRSPSGASRESAALSMSPVRLPSSGSLPNGKGVVDAAHARRTSRFDLVAHQFGVALGGRPAGTPHRPSRDAALCRYLDPSGAPPQSRCRHHLGLSGSMIGPGAAAIATAASSAISSGMPSSTSFPIARWRLRWPGFDSIPASRSYRAIAAVGYAEAAKRALPNAVQVADRWHLFCQCQCRLPGCRARGTCPRSAELSDRETSIRPC